MGTGTAKSDFALLSDAISGVSDVDPDEIESITLKVLDKNDWLKFLSNIGSAFPEAFPRIDLPSLNEEQFTDYKEAFAQQKSAIAFLPPRGIGPTAWTSDKKERIHIRRRFALLGQTQDSMRVWDIRRGIHAIRQMDGMTKPKLRLESNRTMAGNTLYAALFEKGIAHIDLRDLPASHRDGPAFLNVLRYTDIPQTAAMVAAKSKLHIYTEKESDWKFLTEISKSLNWSDDQVEITEVPASK